MSTKYFSRAYQSLRLFSFFISSEKFSCTEVWMRQLKRMTHLLYFFGLRLFIATFSWKKLITLISERHVWDIYFFKLQISSQPKIARLSGRKCDSTIFRSSISNILLVSPINLGFSLFWLRYCLTPGLHSLTYVICGAYQWLVIEM